MSASEVTVLAFGGRTLRRAACALGLHGVKEGPVPGTGPTSIRFCIWCGLSNDPRWCWVWTNHRSDLDSRGRTVSLVTYREAVA